MRRNRATLPTTVVLALILALIVPQLAFAQSSQTNGPLKRVLILHSFGREFAPFGVMSATFRTELARRSPVPVEFHEASIEMARFSEIVNEQPVADYLQALFKDRRLDLIVSMGGPATLFVNRHREQLFPEVPVVATMDQRRVKEAGVSTNMTVVTLDLNLPGLIEDILAVRPATTNVFVVFGVSPFEQYWAAQCQREFAAFTNRITFTFWNDLSLEAMTKRVATLPPDSAVWYGALVMDAAGVPHEQETALAALHASANAPIFGVFQHQLGLGIVGGRLTSNEAWGRRTAAAALRILNGEPPDQIKSEPTGPEMPVYDWRELRRWGISQAQLPRGSEIRFREPTLWEAHKWQIIGVIALCSVETALVVALVMQLRQRRQAELERQRARDELAHVARVTTMGQLASTLAHELNQPLGAILHNAKAAELFLQHNPPDYEEVRAILADIRRDDERAGDVIDRMRSLLKRQDLRFEPLRVKELIGQVATLTHSELEARRVALQVDLPPDLPPVRGDRVQLQQVLINLLINGADAMQELPPERRQLVVRAQRSDKHTLEFSVSDNGQGIPADKLGQIFEPFFTTKSNGLGMGLAISQTIINAHGGRIWAENNTDGGATIRFSLKEAGENV